MAPPRFEWFVAWRHLGDPQRRSGWLLRIGVALLVLAGLAAAAAALAPGPRSASTFLGARPTLFVSTVRMVAIVTASVGWILTLLGLLLKWFTVFTAVSIFSVFLGTCMPIVALSVMSGFENDLKRKIRGGKADVVITMAGDEPFLDHAEVRARIAGVAGLKASTPFIEAEVMLKSSSSAAGVILKGIDPVSAGGVIDLVSTLREGRLDDLEHPERISGSDFPPAPQREVPIGSPGGSGGEEPRAAPTAPDRADGGKARAAAPAADGERPALPGIIVGDELYNRTLRVFVGSTVDVACPQCRMSPTGPVPHMKAFRIAGHFYSGYYEFDQKWAYVSLSEAQRFLGMPGEVSGIEIRVADPARAGEVSAAVGRLLGRRYEARSWEDLNKGLFAALKLEKIAMFVVLTFIVLVAAFSIMSMLIMLVSEKSREVAILKSMGADDGSILRVFVAEGLYIGLLGMLLGLPHGIGVCLSLDRFGLPLDPDVYYIQKLPVVLRASEIGAVGLAALGLCFLATLYPAWRAARLRPIEGLRYD